MRAVVRFEYGDTSVLRVADVPEPVLEEGRVIVKVAAAGVNMAEWHLMAGEPTLARLAMGLLRPKRAVLGEDLAGVVTAVGPGVTRFAVGDPVFGSGRGSWAESVSAKEELLQPLPAGVSFEQAAVVPMSGYTALQALRLVGDPAGKHVAITGAGGGVGSYAVQLAHSRGAHVTAICSAAKAAFVRQLGADDTIDHQSADPTQGPRRFDAVLDFAGSRPLAHWKRVITPGGTLVLGGGEGGGRLLGPLSRSLRAPFTRGIKAVTLMASSRGEDLAELGRALASGELRSTLSHLYTFAEAAQAIDALRAATHPGKIALVP
jgi:NADPH:quinone reductase-like Zn-dependent oxidoreductase